MKRLHRAWAICLGCTLMLFVCGGLSVNAFSVTQPYVLAYGGFTNTQTSMINTIRALSYLGCMFAAPLFFRTLGYRLGTAVAVAFPPSRSPCSPPPKRWPASISAAFSPASATASAP